MGKRSEVVLYELWDLRASNLLRTFDTKRDALAVLRAGLGAFGASYVERMALLRQDTRGQVQLVAERADLVALALAEQPELRTTA